MPGPRTALEELRLMLAEAQEAVAAYAIAIRALEARQQARATAAFPEKLRRAIAAVPVSANGGDPETVDRPARRPDKRPKGIRDAIRAALAAGATTAAEVRAAIPGLVLTPKNLHSHLGGLRRRGEVEGPRGVYRWVGQVPNGRKGPPPRAKNRPAARLWRVASTTPQTVAQLRRALLAETHWLKPRINAAMGRIGSLVRHGQLVRQGEGYVRGTPPSGVEEP